MSGRSIFAAQQELVGIWSEQTTTHEANLALIQERLMNVEPKAPVLTVPGASKTVAAQTVVRSSEDVVQIFSSLAPPSTDNNNSNSSTDVTVEYRRRALMSLTFVIDEIFMLKRKIDDGDSATLLDQVFVSKRLGSLLSNLLKQCLGINKTRLIYDGKLEKIKIIWLALADGLSALLTLSKKPLSKDDMLVYNALEFISKDLQEVPQSEKMALSEQGIKVLKGWCESALTAWDVLRCASLVLVLHRVGYKQSHAPMSKVHALSKISPILPVFIGRKCVKLEDYLFLNAVPLPNEASGLARDLSNVRKTVASSVAQNIDDFAKRLSHDLAFKQNLQTAERVRHLAFSLLYNHAVEKLSLPKHTLGSLLILIEGLVSCENILYDSAPVVPSELAFLNAPDVPQIVLQLAKGSRTLSPTRAIAITLALGCSTKNESLHEIHLQSEMESIRSLRRCCDAASLFGPFSELFEPMIKVIVEGDIVQLPRRLPPLVMTFRSENESIVLKMRNILREWLVDFLFEEIDQILRSRLVMKETNDTNLAQFIQRVVQIKVALDCPPMDLSGTGLALFNIKREVEDQIERTWHEMRCTGIDRTWETYAEMLVMAKDYFDLDIVLDPLVPAVSSVTGCDVLEIARDVAGFCARFNYNMNQEFFIERRPHGKYVNLVTVDSIYRSIRSHGSGILSSTVNVVYQFLAMRFEQFSQSLFDEHVKSFLKRERRWMAREQVATAGAFYPFERATDFSQNVKQASFLQKTKTIVTEIGNALGFVRTVRAGALRWAGSVHRFAVSSRDEATTKTSSQSTTHSESEEEGDATTKANQTSSTLNRHLNDVALKQIPDYIQLLVDVFRRVESSKNEHLKHAFMLIPALCVDYVDSSLFAKDQVARVHKNPNREAYFTDDGFVMGVSAILAMLNQDLHFDSLKFFKGVAVYFEGNAGLGGGGGSGSAAIEQQPHQTREVMTARSNDELSSDLVAGLSKRRHRGAAREYELLMYALSGARVFFKRNADEASTTPPESNTVSKSVAPQSTTAAGEETQRI